MRRSDVKTSDRTVMDSSMIVAAIDFEFMALFYQKECDFG